jgi:hypothetical protein
MPEHCDKVHRVQSCASVVLFLFSYVRDTRHFEVIRHACTAHPGCLTLAGSSGQKFCKKHVCEALQRLPGTGRKFFHNSLVFWVPFPFLFTFE